MLTFKNVKINEIVNNPQVERYVDDVFYAYTRGKVFVATTNVGQSFARLERVITYHPYSDGTVLCDIFWSGDCVTVQNGKFTIVLLNGESKVFYPKFTN